MPNKEYPIQVRAPSKEFDRTRTTERRPQSVEALRRTAGQCLLPSLPGARKPIVDTAEDGRVLRLRTNAQTEILAALDSLEKMKNWSGSFLIIRK